MTRKKTRIRSVEEFRRKYGLGFDPLEASRNTQKIAERLLKDIMKSIKRDLKRKN